ncbi:MAG TPA: YbfB/YjiJ family MFS transporter [Casimicrobiaceae bacterium]
MTSLLRPLRGVIALSLGAVVAIAFGRFAYALVLPAMRADLGLDYGEAGALNTANALGYLAGALVCTRYVARLGNRRLFSIGLPLMVLALLASGATRSFAAQLCWRALAGVAGAMVYICGAVLASNAFPGRSDRASTAIGVYFCGAGAGMLLAGAGIPTLLAVAGDSAWREAWLAIGGVSVLFAFVALRAARAIDEPQPTPRRARWPIRRYTASLASYFLFGIGYNAYMTFVVALMRSHGASLLQVASTWVVLGLASVLSPIAWRIPRARWHPSKIQAAASLVISVGAAMPLFSTSFPAMLLSATLFGGAMFTIPTAATDLVKASLPRAAWGSAVAVLTVAFAVGQTIGPVLTGWLADRTHSLGAGLALSVVLLLAAGGVALAQPDRGALRIRASLRAAE